MKRIAAVIVSAGVFFLSSGCQNTQNRATEGAVIGGLLGATAGGIIGHQDHHGGEGAAIGLAAGALTGALVGSQVKKPGQGAATQAPAGVNAQANNPNQIPLQQIVSLSKQEINENVIIDKIQLTNSKYNLSASDLEYLKKEGVSDKVIGVMQAR